MRWPWRKSPKPPPKPKSIYLQQVGAELSASVNASGIGVELTPKQARAVVQLLWAIIMRHLDRGHRVIFKGFATFFMEKRPPIAIRERGKTITVPERKNPQVIFTKALRRHLNRAE